MRQSINYLQLKNPFTKRKHLLVGVPLVILGLAGLFKNDLIQCINPKEKHSSTPPPTTLAQSDKNYHEKTPQIDMAPMVPEKNKITHEDEAIKKVAENIPTSISLSLENKENLTRNFHELVAKSMFEETKLQIEGCLGGNVYFQGNGIVIENHLDCEGNPRKFYKIQTTLGDSFSAKKKAGQTEISNEKITLGDASRLPGNNIQFRINYGELISEVGYENVCDDLKTYLKHEKELEEWFSQEIMPNLSALAQNSNYTIDHEDCRSADIYHEEERIAIIFIHNDYSISISSPGFADPYMISHKKILDLQEEQSLPQTTAATVLIDKAIKYLITKLEK